MIKDIINTILFISVSALMIFIPIGYMFHSEIDELNKCERREAIVTDVSELKISNKGNKKLQDVTFEVDGIDSRVMLRDISIEYNNNEEYHIEDKVEVMVNDKNKLVSTSSWYENALFNIKVFKIVLLSSAIISIISLIIKIILKFVKK